MPYRNMPEAAGIGMTNDRNWKAGTRLRMTVWVTDYGSADLSGVRHKG